MIVSGGIERDEFREVVPMLSMKRCPHTGIVNFYDAREPHMAVGSVSQVATVKAGRSLYTWRTYAGGQASGIAADLKTAEKHIAHFSVQRVVDDAGLLTA
jgi:hypothetical protein